MQSASGTTYAEADLATRTNDQIQASGTVQVGGTVDLTLLNKTHFTPGPFSAKIFTGQAGATLDAATLRANSSVVLHLLGIKAAGNAVEVDYNLGFTPADATGNLGEVGDYLDRVQMAGASPALQPVFDELVAVQDSATYLGQLTELGADFYAEQNAQALAGTLAFGRQMMNCGATFAGLQERSRDCAWAQYQHDSSTIDAQNGTPAMSSTSDRFTGGVRYGVGGGLSAIVSVGVDRYHLNGNASMWTASGTAKEIGVGARYGFGGTAIGASLSLGSFGYDSQRSLPDFGGQSARSSRSLFLINGELTAEHRFAWGGLSVTPGRRPGLHLGQSGDIDRNRWRRRRPRARQGQPDLFLGNAGPLAQLCRSGRRWLAAKAIRRRGAALSAQVEYG